MSLFSLRSKRLAAVPGLLLWATFLSAPAFDLGVVRFLGFPALTIEEVEFGGFRVFFDGGVAVFRVSFFVATVFSERPSPGLCVPSFFPERREKHEPTDAPANNLC